jgi:acyl-CoA thioesterase
MNHQHLVEFFGRDRFASGNGISVVELRTGYCRTEMTVEPRHLNAVGILQGGAIFTLADLAFAGASNSHGVVAVSCQSDITCFKAVATGKLTAVAEEVSRTHKLSTCVVHVTHESEGLVALFKGIAYIKGSPLPL